MDLSFATATELVAALRAGDLSSRELLDHVVARIDEVNPPLNAVVTLDLERATARREPRPTKRTLAATSSGRCTAWS